MIFPPALVRAGEFRLTRQVWPSRVSPLISYTRLKPSGYSQTPPLPPAVRDGVDLYYRQPSTAIGPVPSLSGQAITYRLRSLPRVLQHRPRCPHGRNEFRRMHALSTLSKRTTPLTEPSSGEYSPVFACHQNIISVIHQFHDGMRACVRLDDRVYSGGSLCNRAFVKGACS